MELSARIRPVLLGVALPAALMALAAPATAGAAKKKPKAPIVTAISPKTVAVNRVLTIRGRNFVRGRNKNTVVFKRTGAKAVFVKAEIGTAKLLRVTIPPRLAKLLVTRDGEPISTRFRLRVLARRFGKSFTKRSLSPFVTPEPPKIVTPPTPPAEGDCDDDGIKNGVDADDDNDLLDDATEARLKLDACKPDTDGDGVADGYEYQSAIDLNDNEYRRPQNIVPAPVKRPYPNPLFNDASNDYDGDGLSLGEEFALWKAYRDPAKGLADLVYSDGNQYSAYGRSGSGHRPGDLIGPDPELKYVDFLNWAVAWGYDPIQIGEGGPERALRDANGDGIVSSAPGGGYAYSEARYYDFDFDGKLSDDERDEDADGLSNYDEAHGRTSSAGWWSGCYKKEKPYPIAYQGTDLVDPDVDGDGIRDGADDLDHDDLPNLLELSRNAASGRPIVNGCNDTDAVESSSPALGRVNPFNPCLPDRTARTCQRYPSFDNAFAPVDNSPNYYVLN